MDTNKVRYMLRQISDDLREYNDKPMAIEEDLNCVEVVMCDGKCCQREGCGTDKGEQS